MAYRAQVGVEVTAWHPVHDVNGNLVASQASACTSELLKPDRTAAAEVVTLEDQGTTGWVKCKFTPTILDALPYTLNVTSPAWPAADGRLERYDVQVLSSAAAGADKDLTTLARVREQLQLAVADTDHDALLTYLIDEVSHEYQDRTRRCIPERAYTHVVDGQGGPLLQLLEGPLVSVSQVDLATYASDGAGGVTITYTVVPPETYVLEGRRDHDVLGLGYLRKIAGEWTKGARNYRVSYVAGFDPLPSGLMGLATTRVVAEYGMRESRYQASSTLGDATINNLTPAQLHAYEARALEPFDVSVER